MRSFFLSVEHFNKSADARPELPLVGLRIVGLDAQVGFAFLLLDKFSDAVRFDVVGVAGLQHDVDHARAPRTRR